MSDDLLIKRLLDLSSPKIVEDDVWSMRVGLSGAIYLEK